VNATDSMETDVLRGTFRTLFIATLCAVAANAASAQTTTVVNPKTVEFDPSADHSALGPDGQALVSRYELQVYLHGAPQPISTGNLGKPSPDADGKIRVDFSTLLIGWPLANGTYEARVSAVGSTGTGLSDVSNVFDFLVAPPPVVCTYGLSATAQSASPAGGPASVAVSATATTCAWNASSGAAWLAVSPASGTGSGSVNVTVAANAGAARTGTLTIAGQTYTVSQGAVPCGFSLSSSSTTVAPSGGTSSVNVGANLSGCGWTASSGAAWATVTPASGTGSGSVSVTVAANSGAARSATLTIGGQSYVVSQAAVPLCTLSVSPTSVTVSGSAGTSTLSLTANSSSCAWTASSAATWITLTTESGTGSAAVGYSIAKNNSGASRTGTVTAGGQVVTVTQPSARPSPPKGVKAISTSSTVR
jgi:hypothetical protein